MRKHSALRFRHTVAKQLRGVAVFALLPALLMTGIVVSPLPEEVTPAAEAQTASVVPGATGRVQSWAANGFSASHPATKIPAVLASGVSQVEMSEALDPYGVGPHALAIKEGKVYAWGANESGQATVPDYLMDPEHPPIVDIAAGWHTSFALDSEGIIHGWGAAAQGTDIQHKAGGIQFSEIAAGHRTVMAITKDRSGLFLAPEGKTIPLKPAWQCTQPKMSGYFGTLKCDGKIVIFNAKLYDWRVVVVGCASPRSW